VRGTDPAPAYVRQDGSLPGPRRRPCRLIRIPRGRVGGGRVDRGQVTRDRMIREARMTVNQILASPGPKGFMNRRAPAGASEQRAVPVHRRAGRGVPDDGPAEGEIGHSSAEDWKVRSEIGAAAHLDTGTSSALLHSRSGRPRRFTLPTTLTLRAHRPLRGSSLRIPMHEPWVWDMYRPARFVKSVRL